MLLQLLSLIFSKQMFIRFTGNNQTAVHHNAIHS
ncbi:hypothetical protein GKG47_15715 [Lactonifactor sp. BIOML-A3]|nr:hypothetical protein [Lactonifactor sp. BIOML-A5]MSA08726.1 hypothetical protein [Lactonifactor sp. BIOML-A4]MSA13878.1 hypothetical protein [Lactonifactor sp. BIOML-A3]MSA17119.1 hypothetical protein [Lactonifactor sp. BIOML-A2]MSA37798.1 hypothetical protein [Lactonifactor sp. BIOML-A1]MSB13626.1 hypothetical protein [Lactonifactor sp. BIOML-A6]MSB70492.1 hypothetical protein [Lactonifactor sp. BIOML-A7]